MVLNIKNAYAFFAALEIQYDALYALWKAIILISLHHQFLFLVKPCREYTCFRKSTVPCMYLFGLRYWNQYGSISRAEETVYWI